MLNKLRYRPSELHLLKNLKNLIEGETIELKNTCDDHKSLKRTDNGSIALMMPAFSVNEVFLLLNAAEKGLIEVTIFVVLISRYFEEMLYYKPGKDEVPEHARPVDDLDLAVRLACKVKSMHDCQEMSIADYYLSKKDVINLKYSTMDILVVHV